MHNILRKSPFGRPLQEQYINDWAVEWPLHSRVFRLPKLLPWFQIMVKFHRLGSLAFSFVISYGQTHYQDHHLFCLQISTNNLQKPFRLLKLRQVTGLGEVLPLHIRNRLVEGLHYRILSLIILSINQQSRGNNLMNVIHNAPSLQRPRNEKFARSIPAFISSPPNSYLNLDFHSHCHEDCIVFLQELLSPRKIFRFRLRPTNMPIIIHLHRILILLTLRRALPLVLQQRLLNISW